MIHEQDVKTRITSTLDPKTFSAPGVLRYNSEDPLAVALDFLGPGNPTWTFGKTILFDAIARIGVQGDGDVQILNDDDDSGTFVFFLSSPEGVAAVRISTDDVVQFADEIMEIEHSDSEDIAISTALDRFLAEHSITEGE
jgi:hypothetical protein